MCWKQEQFKEHGTRQKEVKISVWFAFVGCTGQTSLIHTVSTSQINLHDIKDLLHSVVLSQILQHIFGGLVESIPGQVRGNVLVAQEQLQNSRDVVLM